MPLIDTSYFDGLTGLDNISSAPVAQAVTNAIARYEKEYLKLMLGPSLYDAFMAGLDAGDRSYFSDQFSDQFVKSALDDRWQYLRDGYSFTADNGRAYIWPGFVNDEKVSPIADYVYWYFRRDNLTRPSSLSESRMKSENADTVSPRHRMVDVWNRMVDQNQALAALLTCTTLYPEFDACSGTSRRRRDLFCYQNMFNI